MYNVEMRNAMSLFSLDELKNKAKASTAFEAANTILLKEAKQFSYPKG